MNVYEEIDQETMMLLLDSLCKRTVEGKQIWENMEYNPISFLQKDIYEKEGTCISQMFEATTVFNNIEYELELSESIELPSGKGDIFGTISYETKVWTSEKISPKQILGMMRNKKILKIRRFVRDFACNRPDFMINRSLFKWRDSYVPEI